jgi:hypothetical protein
MRKVLSFVITLMLVMCTLLIGAIAVYADAGGDVTNFMDIADSLASYSVVIIGVLGALSFMVQVIVQVTKEMSPFIKIPTKMWAIFVSLIVCQLALFIYASWASIMVIWYYVVLALFMGFVVAYIAIFGWDTLKELYLRYSKLKE